MKIAVVANSAWYLANFRLRLMHSLRDVGHEVLAVSADGADVQRLVAAGVRHLAIPLSASSINPLRELSTTLSLRRVLRQERIDVVLTYTPKGNIYAALARISLPCRQIANVSGLGSSFIRHDWLTHLVRLLYQVSFRSIDWVFFQNHLDRAEFLKARIVDAARTECLPGSGVDLDHFASAPLPRRQDGAGDLVFLMVARLLADKGVHEYVDAARSLRSILPSARWQLLGSAAADNPSAVSAQTLRKWIDEGVVDYLGSVEDVRPAIARADCGVLPSYREGMSRALLEAAAMGRPLIATDVPGCRDLIDDGVNGFLCAPRDTASLARAMLRMARLPNASRERMGHCSRLKIAGSFSEDIVMDRYAAAIERLTKPPVSASEGTRTVA